MLSSVSLNAQPKPTPEIPHMKRRAEILIVSTPTFDANSLAIYLRKHRGYIVTTVTDTETALVTLQSDTTHSYGIVITPSRVAPMDISAFLIAVNAHDIRTILFYGGGFDENIAALADRHLAQYASLSHETLIDLIEELTKEASAIAAA